MKKLFAILSLSSLLLAGSVICQAQHLTFKGVPITGTLKEFTNAMVQKGFHHEVTQDGVAVFSGDFAGYKDCSIGVLTLHNQDMVNQVTVFFSDHDTWSSLQSQYENLKALLTKKYGAPAEWSERFTSMAIPSDHGKIYALHSGEYYWYTKFITENGEIRVSLVEGMEYHTGRVCLIYYDKTNTEKARQAAFDDL